MTRLRNDYSHLKLKAWLLSIFAILTFLFSVFGMLMDSGRGSEEATHAAIGGVVLYVIFFGPMILLMLLFFVESVQIVIDLKRDSGKIVELLSTQSQRESLPKVQETKVSALREDPVGLNVVPKPQCPRCGKAVSRSIEMGVTVATCISCGWSKKTGV